MGRSKIAITIDEQTLGTIDRLVSERRFPNRSQAIQEALDEKSAPGVAQPVFSDPDAPSAAVERCQFGGHLREHGGPLRVQHRHAAGRLLAWRHL